MNRYIGNDYATMKIATRVAKQLAESSDSNDHTIPDSMKFFGVQYNEGKFWVVQPHTIDECNEKTIARYYFR